MKKKIITTVIVIAMLLSYFLPLKSVFATNYTTTLTVTFRDDNANYGKVQYSLDNGNSWNNVTSNIEDEELTVTGSNLRLKIVPNTDYIIDYAGIELRLDKETKTNVSAYGFEDEDGYAVDSSVGSVALTDVEFRSNALAQDQAYDSDSYSVTSDISLTLSGSAEYDREGTDDACGFAFGINGTNFRRVTKDEVDYSTSYGDIVGFQTDDSIEYGYEYNGSGTVTFNFLTQWDEVIEYIEINGEYYYDLPQSFDELTAAFNPEFRGITFEIPDVEYSSSYNIYVSIRKAGTTELIMGNFGWTYDENANTYSSDDKIPHGNLEFVKAVYDGVTYNSVSAFNAAGNTFEWKDANKNGQPNGEAMLPPGTELTIKLVPDAGYQLTDFALNGFSFNTGSEPGVYTFTTEAGNWHLGATFTKVDNKVNTTSNNVKNGDIRINYSGDSSFANGTAKLEVKDVNNLSDGRVEDFTAAAEADGYEISSYIDMSLFNTIYKGGKKDASGEFKAWDTQVDNLSNKASITLALEEDMTGKDVVLVHEKHNGDQITGYELINTTYNAIDNTITFKTNSFSNYAIASKDSFIKEYEVEDENGNTVKFKEESGHDFTLTITDYLTFKDADFEAAGIDKAEFNEGVAVIKNNTKKYGELVGLLDIKLVDENGTEIHEGPFNIKIKMTDAMKKYNSFKIVYVDENNEFKTEEPITLTQDGDYLVGTLNHLSTYAVTGSIESNPNTGDKVMLYVTVLGISIIGLAGLMIYKKKNKSIED